MGERESKTPQAMKQRQQRRRAEAEKEADRAAMMASVEAVLGPLTKPQAVLQRIIDENPNAGRSVWDALFLLEVRDDPDLKRAVVDKVFNGLWQRLRAN